MHTFDAMIVGGGAAGLSLAFHIVNEPLLAAWRVVLVEKEEKKDNDRTWCFWTEESLPYPEIIHHRWKRLTFDHPKGHLAFDLGQMTYAMIRGENFYAHVQKVLTESGRVTWVRGTFEQATEHAEEVEVRVSGEVYRAKWLFDSAFSVPELQQHAKGRQLLLQHFRGWKVRTQQPAFDPSVMKMFDFTIPQQNEVRFVYILPFSAHEAIVEYTIFSDNLLEEADYQQVLADYMKPYGSYEILEHEQGVIPMTDAPLSVARGKRIIQIGTKAGNCKPSTGYAFLRIQRDSRQIARWLAAGKVVHRRGISPKRFWLYDAMMLYLMAYQGGQVRDYFWDIFSKNPIRRVLRFLDEQTHFGEELFIMASVPSWPFLKTLLVIAWREVRLGFGKK